ncbi:MAG: ArsR family transcriptional regulator [Phenylobacterium sp.]|nr:MAG: ArsR family transcriptional regulator [Phenylobacterium sp.]
MPPPTAELSARAFPIRAIARLMGAYVLRVAEKLGAIGDLLDGLIVLEVFRSNTEHLPRGPTPGDGPDNGIPVADEHRRPIAVTALARRLGVPHETARRHVAGLIARDTCRRVRGGLIIPAETLSRPQLRGVLVENSGNLHRLFGALSQLGVLVIWDSVRLRA